ncbi:MAG: histidine phosphatase family protein, partial [Planctomycetota bacterium]
CVMNRAATLTRVLVIRPGATDFDDQGRMKGSLDMPLSDQGLEQARSLADELSSFQIKTLFCAPCESARETASLIAGRQRQRGSETKVKVLDAFRNLDHGLWHGKLIDEVRRNHPKVYRQGADHPDEFCPPEGEPVAEVKARITKSVRKCVKKGREELVAILVTEPLASIVESELSGNDLESLWSRENDDASWTLLEAEG